jgi:hypothetical protein
VRQIEGVWKETRRMRVTIYHGFFSTALGTINPRVHVDAILGQISYLSAWW